MFDIKKELGKTPKKPGVYIMRDENNTIIYVGKANILSNRLRQYFQSSSKMSPKNQLLVSNIKRFEYIVTASELEALILECNLIKKNKPKFNILLKDDKSYPYIKVTLNEEYPRIFLTRRVENDGAKYFGPYSKTTAVKGTIELVKKTMPIKTCNKVLPRDIGKSRPCLNFHINKCLAPCQGNVNKEEYREFMNDVCDFLDGKHDRIIKRFEKLMKAALKEMNFERAANLRDRISNLKHISERQIAVSDTKNDKDIIALATSDTMSCAQIFSVRNGKLTGRENFKIRHGKSREPSEILNSFIKQFYNSAEFIPDELIVQYKIEDIDLIKEWLSQKKSKNVKITIPQKGEKKELIKMAEENAVLYLKRETDYPEKNEQTKGNGIKEAMKLMNLQKTPERIEAYDISNFGNTEIVASMVVFKNGKPDKKQYRRFKIKSAPHQDDYASMQEVLFRRFRHAKTDAEKGNINGSFSEMPDLIFIDGGKGQVNAVKDVLKTESINIPVYGMVKDKRHRTRGIIHDNEELKLDDNLEALRFITSIQNETHRFAIEYSKKLRDKKIRKSILDEIEGVGQKRKSELIKHFGSIEKIKKAQPEELESVKGMNKALAERVYRYFEKQK